MLYVIDVIRVGSAPATASRKLLLPPSLTAGEFEAPHLAGLLQWVSNEREEGSKENRADPFVAQCERGFVKLLEAPWNRDFVDELCAFPQWGA
jgi:phage terminase large subunit-like protein